MGYQSTIAADIATMATRPQLPGNRTLKEADPEVYGLVEEEKARSMRCIELIASENFTSGAVMECLGSCLTNKYSEGQAGSRYYGGNEVIDKIENLCKKRALEAFGLKESEWGVNVQPYSGSPANFAVYTGLLAPHARIMGLDLPSGGHLTHGFYTLDKKTMSRKPVSATSVYFESLPYRVHPETGLIDFDELAKTAGVFKPALIVCGGSAYPRDWDYAKFREIADANGSLLMMDMAHISGLVAAQEAADPFKYCDVVTSTTHKSLRGPRSGIIFFRKGPIDGKEGAFYDYEDKINFAVFPSLQGGPHNHQIGALCVALKQVKEPAFKKYIQQVKANSVALADYLNSKDYDLVTKGTENHLVLWNLRPQGLTGNKMEKVADLCHITLNKNAVFGDSSALSPGGVRIGMPAMTSRGCVEADFVQVGEFLHECVQICLEIQAEHGKMMKDFVKGLAGNGKIEDLRKRVNEWSTKFDIPGY